MLGYLTDDCDLNKNTLSGFFGGNGDTYITIQSRNLDGFCTGTHSVRVSNSGGNFPCDVKVAAAEFVRALEKHQHAVKDGRYFESKDNIAQEKFNKIENLEHIPYREDAIGLKEIKELNVAEPYCFESNREEQWYQIGLRYGAEIAEKEVVNRILKYIKEKSYIGISGQLICNFTLDDLKKAVGE